MELRGVTGQYVAHALSTGEGRMARSMGVTHHICLLHEHGVMTNHMTE